MQNNQDGSQSQQSSSKEETKKPNSDLKIMEWRFNQFLGEKLSYEQIKNDPENESFLVTCIIFSNDGSHVVVSDKGGRVIIFKKTESKTKPPKLDYFYEFQAQEKDFDVHKSIEYSEEIKGMSILPSVNYQKLDLLTAGFRTIKLDRIYTETNRTFEPTCSSGNGLSIPKVTSSKSELKFKTKKLFRCTHSNEINSLSLNKTNSNNFISSDEFKVYLWDLNSKGNEVYTPVDIDPNNENDNVEKITKTTYCDYNPHVFIYGTNRGNIRLCDLRAGSDQIRFAKNFFDDKANIANVIANSLLSVHDISTSFNSNYSFATRHYFAVNLWDIRKQNEPSSKFLTYEPVINKLTYLYQNNYINDKFSLSTDSSGKYILTGGYNNMFHVIDIEQRLNTQIVLDDTNEKLMNTNVIRKINAKGSCYYKKDDPSINNFNFDQKILHQAYSPVGHFALLIIYNCIYSYTGNIAKKK